MTSLKGREGVAKKLEIKVTSALIEVKRKVGDLHEVTGERRSTSSLKKALNDLSGTKIRVHYNLSPWVIFTWYEIVKCG